MKTVMVLALALAVSISSSQAQTNQKKITVYTDEFAGNSRELGPGEYDNIYLIRAGIITVKSVKVPKGMKVTIYTHDQFSGQALELTEDANTSFLESKGYAQTILSVSLVVEELVAPSATSRPSVTIYRDDFSGASKILEPGSYEFNELGNVGNDQLSSIKIPTGLKVTLYEHGGFKGRTLVLKNDTRAAILVRSKFNDLTSSILVEVEPVTQVVPATVLPATTVVVVPPAETQPVTVAGGVVVKEPAEPIIYAGDFSGASKSIRAGRYSSEQLGIGNDQLSSIKVPRGYKVTLYDDDAFEGRTLVLTKDARAAFLADSNFNNLTSSILVEALPMVTIYEGDYNGASSNLAPGRYAIKDLGISNDQLSSVRVPAGMRLTLFENDGFWGRSVVLTQDSGTDALSRSAFNDLTSSLVVEVIEKAVRTAILYSDDFSGASIQLAAGRYSAAQLGIGDNTLSSVQIPRGLELTAFDNANFTGRAMTVRGDTRMEFFNNNQFNDIASSVEVKEVFSSDASVTVFSDRFGGRSQSLAPGRYMLRDLSGGDNQISSARVPQGMRVVMFEDDNFQGYSVTAEADVDLSQAFNDRVSSLIVEDIFTPVVSPMVARPAGGVSGGRRPTSSPSGTPAQTQAAPIVPAAAAATAAANAQPPPCAMNPSQFENALNTIRSKNWDAEKMDLARIATKDRCLSVTQVRAIGGVFMSEDLTLEFVKYAYEASSEKSEYYLLQDMFKFMSTREAFTQFLNSK